MKGPFAISCLAALAGCVGTVETTRLNHRYSSDVALEGVSYALPMLQYQITVTHTLTGCGLTLENDGTVKDDTLTFDTKVEPKARYIPGERYNVDYRRLSGLFRTSTFTMEYYPNGTIKSIGAGAEDKTGDALKSAAKLAGGVIALTAGSPTVLAVAGAPPGTGPIKAPAIELFTAPTTAPVWKKSVKAWGCTKKATDRLADLEATKGDLDKAEKALATANDNVEMLSKRFALEVTADGDAKKWDVAVTAQLEKKEALEEARKAFDKAKAQLSVSTVIDWPDFSSYSLASMESTLPKTVEETFAIRFGENGEPPKVWEKLFAAFTYEYEKLGDVELTGKCKIAAGTKPPKPTLMECLSEHLDLTFQFNPDWPIDDQSDKTNPEERMNQGVPIPSDSLAFERGSAAHQGFFYREPAQGGMVICHTRKATNRECKDKKLAEPEMVNFPQAGQLRFIPFRVMPFQGKDQTIEFTEDGYPSKIELKSTKAAGAEALAAGAEALTTISAELEKRDEKRRSDAKAQREDAVAELQSEIDLLEKQKKLAELTAPAKDPSAESVHLAELNADIELKRAELLQMLLTQGLANGAIDPAVLFGAGK